MCFVMGLRSNIRETKKLCDWRKHYKGKLDRNFEMIITGDQLNVINDRS